MGLIFVFLGLVTHAQTTVSIPDTTTSRGEISLPIEVDPDLGDVGSLTLKIEFDTSVLEFLGFSDNPFEGDPNFLTTLNGNQLSIVWFGTTPVEITDKLFNLDFEYAGGTSALEFVGTNEITDEDAQAYNINFVDGSVSELPSTLTLSDEIGIPGESVTVTLTGQNLIEIGSMSLFLSYDPDVAEFTGISDDLLGFGGANGEVNDDGNGTLSLAWASTTAATINDEVLAGLEFDFLEEATTPVEFLGTTEVTDAVGDPITVILNDGSISPPSASFGFQDARAVANSELTVKLNGTLLENIGSFTFDVSYDSDVMTFNRIDTLLVSGSLQANVQSPGTVRLAYFNTDGLDLASGDISHLVFDYTTSETSTTISIAEIEVTDTLGNPVTGIAYLDGTITENTAPVFTASLPDTTILEEETLAYTYQATDADSDELLYSIVDGPGEIDFLTGEYTWTPSIVEAGEYTLTVGVFDGYEITETSSTITVENKNRAPVFTATVEGRIYTPDYFSDTDTWKEYTLQYEATDPDEDELTFSLVDGPSGVTVSPAGLFSWAPTDEHAEQMFDVIVSVTDGELVVYDTSQVTVSSVVSVEDEVIPTEFSLDQNYPNPFNPTTTIKFGLPEASDISLKVFNILGQEVHTLINRNMTAGFHTINFDASNLMSGMYIYRIQASGAEGKDFTDVKKMLLIK